MLPSELHLPQIILSAALGLLRLITSFGSQTLDGFPTRLLEGRRAPTGLGPTSLSRR